MKSSVIVVGAGFAGLAASKHVDVMVHRGKQIQVKLIDCNPYTTMVPALPDIAGGHYDAKYVTGDIESQISPHMDFHNERVQAVDFNERKVATDKQIHDYDYLVLATGSTTDFQGFDQHLESIHKLDTIGDAKKTHQSFSRYLHDAEHPEVIVSGAGYTGFEIACNLQFAGRDFMPPPRITIVELQDQVLPAMPDYIRDCIAAKAEDGNMELMTGVTVKNYNGRDVELSSGEVREDVFLCWATGTKRPIGDIKGDYKQTADGRIEVDKHLRIPSHPEVFVAGDAAALKKGEEVLRKAVNFSLGSGRCAGDNIVRDIQGQPLKKFRPVDLGWIIPFCDVGVGKIFSRYRVTGRLPILLHYLMCSHRNYNLQNRFFYLKKALGFGGLPR